MDDKRKEIQNYRSLSHRYAKDDKDYYYEFNKLKPSFKDIDECIAFYKLWFNIYQEVKEGWDKGE